jgi:hypothetical protein
MANIVTQMNPNVRRFVIFGAALVVVLVAVAVIRGASVKALPVPA